VSPEYFSALNIAVEQGRSFNQEDLDNEIRLDAQVRELTKDGAQLTPEQAKSMVYRSVINSTMAKHFWPGQNPVGQLYTGDARSPWHQVVGVVGDVKQWGLTKEAQPETYDVFDGQSGFFLVIHTKVDPASITSAVRQAVGSVDSGLPLFRIRTMQDVINDNSAGAQFVTTLLGVFAGLALVLAAIGIYGVLSYLVTQRTREIGIRMALGATPGNVLRLVLAHGLKLAICGFLIGGFGAYATRKVIASSLLMIKAEDPLIFLGTPLLLLFIAVLACLIPASRAARISPLVALRED
jgi:predicted permease